MIFLTGFWPVVLKIPKKPHSIIHFLKYTIEAYLKRYNVYACLFLLDEEILKNMRFLTGFWPFRLKIPREPQSKIYFLKDTIEAYLKRYNV